MNKLSRMFLLLMLVISFAPLAKAKDLTLTIVYDNNTYDEELETRWGFSCLVEGLEKTILFDVGGEGDILLNNMEKLGIDPKAIDIIVLSHIHHDHIGGLSAFLKENPGACVYLPGSFPQSIKNEVKKVDAKLIEVHNPIRICKNAYSTGELGAFIKEQSLIIKTDKGLIIITGCAHPGIVNVIKKAKGMLKKEVYPKGVYLVLGGFHLCWMNAWQVKGIINGVKKEKVEKVAPSHCSGDLARKLFKKAYGKNFILSGAGKKIRIKDAF
ncbi:MBL fold metallo-hydrolase [candidate division WOR-3 bacterium]|nr:MBL fold metallo-hydrolase [candidate division WOR-3 bacterium]